MTSIFGSNFLKNSDRLRSLDNEMLKANILGYKVLLRQLRVYKANLAL